MHDLVIRGGTVVDGTGAAPRVADIAMQDVDGYRHTIKSGVVTFTDGVATGARPGTVLRSGR